jgi:hypothetical protein
MNMHTIHKAHLAIGHNIVGSVGYLQVIHVASQHEMPTIWYECDTSLSHVTREFMVIGTGHEVPPITDGWVHMGSCQCADYVWHVYERSESMAKALRMLSRDEETAEAKFMRDIKH